MNSLFSNLILPFLFRPYSKLSSSSNKPFSNIFRISFSCNRRDQSTLEDLHLQFWEIRWKNVYWKNSGFRQTERKLSENCENHANGVKCFLSFKEDIFTRSAVITRSNKQIHLKTFKQLIEGERSQNLLWSTLLYYLGIKMTHKVNILKILISFRVFKIYLEFERRIHPPLDHLNQDPLPSRTRAYPSQAFLPWDPQTP